MPRFAALLFLLLGAAVPAQAVPGARERQDRRLALTGSAAEPVPVLRVAGGVLTALVFDAPLERDSLELEGRERFRLVDVGERSVLLEPVADLAPGERLGLRVRFSEGERAEPAVLMLVTHPSDVDARVRIFRRALSVPALQAELAEVRAQLMAQGAELAELRSRREATGPSRLALAGLLDGAGVVTSRVEFSETKESLAALLESVGGFSLRAQTWGLVSVTVRNNGPTAWTPVEARLTEPGNGERTRVLRVHMTQPQIGPGEQVVVVVEAAAPPWNRGAAFSLELLDASGARRLLLTRVVL
ncbi:DUF2381 family protein [Corallococcus sp. ZKHCc1 1396]|uniref:DUF2381 family protein n=1 Tax=Corallococcus soli TaxID=2710757 RepID=A0ABR9PTY9_9BACT|nr:DUF2381 family protein [Corallococcus soli]MBE4751403.1 DUF2381 family protein [Corallococcus soli]